MHFRPSLPVWAGCVTYLVCFVKGVRSGPIALGWERGTCAANAGEREGFAPRIYPFTLDL